MGPSSSQYYPQLLKSVCKHYDIDMDVPVKELPKNNWISFYMDRERERILFRYQNDFGQVRESKIVFEGVIRNVERRYQETSSDYIREQMEKYMAEQPCPVVKVID